MQRTLSEREALFMQGLVRMHIRKIAKSIDRFEPRPGQPQDEAQEVLAAFRVRLEFAREAYRALGGNPDTMAPKGGKE